MAKINKQINLTSFVCSEFILVLLMQIHHKIMRDSCWHYPIPTFYYTVHEICHITFIKIVIKFIIISLCKNLVDVNGLYTKYTFILSVNFKVKMNTLPYRSIKITLIHWMYKKYYYKKVCSNLHYRYKSYTLLLSHTNKKRLYQIPVESTPLNTSIINIIN